MSTQRLSPPGDVEPVRVSIERPSDDSSPHWTIELDGQPIELVVGANGAGSGWFRRDGETQVFHATGDAKTIRVWIRGRTYAFQRASRSAQRASAGVHGAIQENLKAPMPGTVLQIKINEGEAFDAKQALIILESMKMEMTLSLPHGGVVDKVHCKQGDLVDMGAVLATLREADDA